MNGNVTTEDRIWAVLAHLSALVTGVGLPLPVVGWAEQRRKSKYASFQCLQALGYQSLGYTVWILFTILIILIIIIGLIGAMSIGEQNHSSTGVISAVFMNVIFVVMLALIGLYFSLPIVGAVACALGREFRYPLLGNRLAEYLDYGSDREGWLDEDHEDRWVAAMGHFTVIIALWGMLAPLTAWIMQGKRSDWLKFQSMQTIVFQAFVVLLSFAAGAVYLFGFIVFIVTVGLGEAGAVDSQGGMAGPVVLILSMLMAVLFVLFVPLFHILGQWAGYRVLKGDNYLYPALGKFIARRFDARPAGEMLP
jgi:uncharacterized Tic20 family protein